MIRFRSSLTVALAAASILIATGCRGNAPDEPVAKPVTKPASPIAAAMFGAGSQDEGEALFGRECAFCHVGKATGAIMLGRRLGKENSQLVERTDLDADYVKAVTRNGLMNMPAFSRVELTDPELDKIARYLSRKKS